MAFNYTPKTWKNGPTGGTPITADELTRIDTGVKLAGDIADTAVAATAATKSEVTAALAGKAAAMPGSNLVMGGHFQTIAQMEAAYPLAAIPEGVVILCSTEED